MIGKFDFVISFGVVEHFEDTTAALSAFSRLLKPGGIMITFVPNLVGTAGHLLKLLNEELYNIHVPLSAVDLRRHSESADLDIIESGYFCFMHFGVCHVNNLDHDTIEYTIKSRLLYLLTNAALPLWMIEDRTSILRPNKFTSSHVLCLAQKSEETLVAIPDTAHHESPASHSETSGN
jgi:2-polyprenyl-3-methyl-5-hydroxy-6-metoxy-1,4-benzoquinol methylase